MKETRTWYSSPIPRVILFGTIVTAVVQTTALASADGAEHFLNDSWPEKASAVNEASDLLYLMQLRDAK